jgi:hypothetical protein
MCTDCKYCFGTGWFIGLFIAAMFFLSIGCLGCRDLNLYFGAKQYAGARSRVDGPRSKVDGEQQEETAPLPHGRGSDQENDEEWSPPDFER